MSKRILVKTSALGHTRWIQLEVAANELTVLLSQTTGPRETLAPLPRIRLREGETVETVLEHAIVAELVAAGGEVVEVHPLDPGFLQRIRPEVERRRTNRATEIERAVDELERAGAAVTRGTPWAESAVETLEAELGVPLPREYRRFLSTFGSLHLDVYGMATTWILGEPIMVGDVRLGPAQARESFAARLAARRAQFPEPSPSWSEQPSAVVPLITSASDLYYVVGVDNLGRMVRGDLRYATLEVVGDQELWADFDAMVLREIGRLRGELHRSEG